MYIAMIMAGDGEIEMVVAFDTREQAEEVGKELFSAYDPAFDRLYVVGVETVEQARRDIQEMKQAEAEYQAEQHPEGIIVEVHMNKEEN